MNTKAIIASLSLVLASSAAAVAAPSGTVTASGHVHTTTVIRDHRAPVIPPMGQPSSHPAVSTPVLAPAWHGPSRPYKPAPYYRQVTLADNQRFAPDGRTFITVGGQYGRFETLKLGAVHGRTMIKQVYIQFENGQEQVVRNLDRMLSDGQTLKLDLDGGRRAIKRIVVYGKSMNNPRLRIAPAAFNVTAA